MSASLNEPPASFRNVYVTTQPPRHDVTEESDDENPLSQMEDSIGKREWMLVLVCLRLDPHPKVWVVHGPE
jgi:hypothetical protein